MGHMRATLERYGSLGLVLLLLAGGTATIIASCGGGGGGPTGALCSQCGDTDGPCDPTTQVVPGATKPEPCPSVSPGAPGACVTRNLICRRGSTTSQRRCYPANEAGTDVDFFFRCHDEAPGATPVPPTVTPSSTAPTTTPTPSTCGNNILDVGEACDIVNGLVLTNSTCQTFCGTRPVTGFIQCNTDCTIDASNCCP